MERTISTRGTTVPRTPAGNIQNLPSPRYRMPVRTTFLRFVALITLAGGTGLAQSPAAAWTPTPLSPAAVRADVALLRQALEQVHAGYDRYQPRHVLDTAFARLDRRAAEPMTDLDLYREVALLLAKIRCNHTKAEYPESLERYRTESATHLPVTVRIFGERLYVDRSTDPTIARGTEILRINGFAAADVITRLSRYVAVDGFTDFARSTLLERDDDLMGSDLDHYWPVEFGFPTRWTLTLRAGGGAVRTRTLAPITYPAWKGLTGDVAPVDLGNGTQLATLDDTTARLTVRSFVNYRTPVNADSLFGALFTQLRARGVRHLVLDLRGNGGGSSDASEALLRHLIDRDVQPVTTVRRRTLRIEPPLADAFETWGDRGPIFAPDSAGFERRGDGWFAERGSVGTFAPAPAAFAGRTSVLVDRTNSSATTMLLAVLQDVGARTGRLRLVGEETAGSAEGPSAGQILFLRLPAGGMRVRIPLKRSDVNATGIVPGLGVFPDVDATETLADFRARIDRPLQVARTMPWRAPASPLAPTIGLMRGELEYRDYGNDERVRLPSWVHVAPIGMTGAFRERTIYDDGPGKTLFSTDVLRVRGDRWIEGGGTGEAVSPTASTFRVAERRSTPKGQELILLGRGTDNNRPVEVRLTVTLSDSLTTRLKEFRRPGGSWEYRHEYRYRRAPR